MNGSVLRKHGSVVGPVLVAIVGIVDGNMEGVSVVEIGELLGSREESVG
jgi:hypothetical protein